VQAGLERELEAIGMTARAFRGRKDAESVALVRQLMPDVPSCASGPRNGAMSVSASASEEKSSAHWMGIERAEPDFNHKRRPVIEAGRQPTGAPALAHAAICFWASVTHSGIGLDT